MTVDELSAIVLCGGKSSRMGTSKAWIDIDGETFLQRVVKTVGSICRPVVVVAAAGQALPPLPPSVEIAHDKDPERGPLEGLFVGFEAIGERAGKAFVASTDVPLLHPSFIRRLFE